MRPCDGTSGLVRGNRQKAVFALKGLFSKDICHVFALGQRFFIAYSGSAGKNRKSPSTIGFSATKPQVAETQNRGLVGRSRFFPALPEPPVGSMRQIPEPMSTPPFSRRETAGRGVAASRCALHILNLQHTSGFDSVAGRVHSYHRPDNGQNSQSVSILKRRQGRNCSCRRWRACLCCFRLAQRPVLDPYASVGSTPSSLRTSSKAAAMALSMS